MRDMADQWRPWRSVAARLLWAYYKHINEREECDDTSINRRTPKNPNDTRSAVVFLHGYGANGADLLGLADPLADHLPIRYLSPPTPPKTVRAARFINGSQSRGLMDQVKRKAAAACSRR